MYVKLILIAIKMPKEMPKGDNKISKYNHGEKSMKVPFIIYADIGFLLQKNTHMSIIILKSHQQLKKTSIFHLFIHYLYIVHLMLQKISLFIIEVRTVWKFFLKT